MESCLNRYRNITVLLLVIFAQLVLLAVQVKNDRDVRMIRVWTVTAVTPVARVVEWLRGGSTGFVRDYILLHDTHQENKRLQAELDRLKIENIYLKNELNTADRAKALELFQAHTPSRTVAASVIGVGAGSSSRVLFVDRGSSSGVERGMAVVTPDGIVGKVIAAYPTAAEVLLITDPDFAAGVISQKTQVRGTLKGQGNPVCKVDYVPAEEKLQVGDWFYTSGDDRVFPRGFPVGVIKVVRDAQPYKEVLVEPSGLRRGVEDVLILIQGVHQEIPDQPPVSQPVYIAPPPPTGQQAAVAQPASVGTEADKLRTEYKAIGDAQNHKFGEGLPGSKPPDFNLKPPATGQAANATKPAGSAVPGVVALPPSSSPASGASPAPKKEPLPAPAPKPATTKPPTPAAPDAVPPPVPPDPNDLGVAARPHSE